MPQPKTLPRTKPSKIVRKASAPRAVGRPPTKPSVDDATAVARLCGLVAGGMSMAEACARDDCPSRTAVYERMAADEGFRATITRAREAQAHHWADEIITISDDSRNDFITRQTPAGEEVVVNHEHIQRAKLRVDSRKWLLARMLPKLYGDHIEAPGTTENPITLLVKQVQGRTLKPQRAIEHDPEDDAE